MVRIRPLRIIGFLLMMLILMGAAVECADEKKRVKNAVEKIPGGNVYDLDLNTFMTFTDKDAPKLQKVAFSTLQGYLENIDQITEIKLICGDARLLKNGSVLCADNGTPVEVHRVDPEYIREYGR